MKKSTRTPASEVRQLATGQKKPQPGKAWHIAQQARGRVKPTIQAKEVAINDDRGSLECEADAMAEIAAARTRPTIGPTRGSRRSRRA